MPKPNEAIEDVDNTPEPTENELALEAMQKGLAEATEDDEPIMPEVNDEPKADDKPEVKPDEPKPEDVEAKAKEDALNKEMDELGLKARSRERFQKLSHENAELRPIRDALDAAGIKDLNDIPRLVERASAADSFEQALVDTGAPPEDFGKAMDVLRKLNSGDMKQANEAYDALLDTLKEWSPLLGRSVTGIDPLTPELREAVELGEMTEAHAIELSQVRTRDRLVQQHNEVNSQNQNALMVEKTARADLTAWDVSMRGDEQFLAKRNLLMPFVQGIMNDFPPEQWVRKTQEAYARLPNQVIAKPVVPEHRPMRPTGSKTRVIPQTNDPYEAMLNGIKAANNEV